MCDMPKALAEGRICLRRQVQVRGEHHLLLTS